MKAGSLLQSEGGSWVTIQRLAGVGGRVTMAVLTSILVMLAFAATLALHHAAREQRAITHRVQLAARTTAQQVDLEIAAAQALLSGLATSPSLQGDNLSAFYDQLTRSERPAGSQFMLYALDGSQLINTFHPFGAKLPGAMALPANQEAIRTGQPQVSNLIYGGTTDDYVIGVLFPVRRGNTIPYVLAVSLPANSLRRILNQVPPGLTGTILDGTASIIISSSSRKVAQSLDLDLRQIAPGHDRLRATAYADGTPTAASLVHSAVSPWIVMVELPRSVLDTPMRRAMLLIAGSAAVFLLAGIVLAPFASRGIVAVFDRLHSAADSAVHEKERLQALYRTYFDNTTESLFFIEVTPDRRFLFEALNPIHEHLTGLKSDAIRGKEPRECVPPDVAESVTTNYRRCVEEGVPILYDEILSLPGGTRSWETCLVPVRDSETGRICRIIGSARDISDRRAMFDALRESEERFRAMADTVPDILYVSDPQGRCVYASARYYEYTGSSQGAAIGKGWIDAIHPDDRAALSASMRRSRTGRIPLECEFRMRAADGSYRWFVGRSRPIRDEKGRIVRWFGAASDVDDLKRAQGAVESTNRRLRTILTSISDGYYSVDRDGRFVDINEQAALWLDMTPDQMVGRSIAELFPNCALIKHVQDAASQGIPYHLESPSLFRPGRWVDLNVYPSIDGASVLFRDVTRRKLAELSALATQDLLQSTMDALAAHIAILDANGVIVAVNAAWRRFVEADGMKSENAGIGSNYLTICGAMGSACPEASAVDAGLRAIMQGEHNQFRLEYLCPCRDEQRWFQLRATRFGEGDGVRLVLVHEDITEIMQAEQALRRLAGKLLRTQDEERRRIARDLHDSTAQNLLGAALGIERALRLAPHLPERVRAALADSQSLIEQSQQEIRTVSYLLHPPMLDEMGLPSALRWYVEGFTKRSGIAVEATVAQSIEGRRFPFDIEAALFRILQECLTNVHRHSGSATAQIDLMIDTVATGIERLVLRVEDHGRGMLMAARGRMPVEDKSKSASVASIGVGLAGMRERLRQFGGNLEIWSSPKGTMVRASVPVSTAAEPALPDLAPAAQDSVSEYH